MSCYRNIKYAKQGPIFQGMFKAIRVGSNEQLIHLSRYIHLNPLVSYLANDLDIYEWSSYGEYIGTKSESLCAKNEVLAFFKSPKDYKRFVLDQTDYGKSLELLKHASIDEH